MHDAGNAQVGKTLVQHTHAYLGASDSKPAVAQAVLESGMTALLGALAGINLISGAGMLDFLACVSPEKLVLDAEGIRMTRRLLDGIQAHTPTLALELFEGFQFKPDFLKQKATRDLFSREQAIPSAAIDRGSLRSWLESGSPDAFQRACSRADELVSAYTRPDLPGNVENELKEIVLAHSRSAGMDRLPPMEAG
jgi:trimethylamine--corrinoid protein Co-methyltransferase